MEELVKYVKNTRCVMKTVVKLYLTKEVQNTLDKYNLTLYELCYRIKHNIPLEKVFTCKYCGKSVGLNATHGYKEFCNYKCSNKYIANLDKTKDKIKQTCNNKYGVSNYNKSQRYKDRYDEIREKYKQTCNKKYGVEHPSKVKELRNKYEQSLVNKYGVDNPFKLKEVQERSKQTNYKKYGVYYYPQTQEFQEKQYNTKKKHNTFVRSKHEEKVYQLLLTKFNKDDIIRQYRSDLYPFNCDFYIKSLDLYIEYNGTWTHGKDTHGKIYGSFDKYNPEHIKLLEFWKSKNTKFFQNAIYVWTVLDVKKLETFKKNKLNYKIFWNLKEVEEWINE